MREILKGGGNKINLLKLSRGEKVGVSGGPGHRFNSPFAPALTGMPTPP